MDDIRKWFNSKRDYNEGIKLYLAHGDGKLKALFTSEGVSTFKQQKLISSLEAILSSSKKPAKPTEHTPVIKSSATSAEPVKSNSALKLPPEKGWPSNMDEVLKALFLQWESAFHEMNNLVARVGDIAREGLKDPNKKEEAGRMALRILDLDDQCEDFYYNRDYYIEKKKLPEEHKPGELCLDPALWHKKLANHERYARTQRDKLRLKPNDINAAVLLKKHEWFILEYKKLLKMI